MDKLSRYCLNLINGGWIVEIRHIFRKENKCTDHLANLDQDFNIRMLHFFEPRSLKPLPQADAYDKGNVRL